MAQRKFARWTSRIGIILAVAGSAIGLGSFFRFPTNAAQYDGGAFMLAYFCALILVGIPLVWLEWAIGRYGGIWGSHNPPGIYNAATRRNWMKYFGVLGLYVPFIVVVYYTYVESWVLGYSVLSLTDALRNIDSLQGAVNALNTYRGVGNQALALPVLGTAFLAITLFLNFYFAYARVAIDRFSRFVMPVLFILGVILAARALTLPGAMQGLDYLWNPDFSQLLQPRLWMVATGQVLFTLSLGLGAVITYSSFLRKDDDVALSGLSSTTLNEFSEVILGASIVVPTVAAFLLTNNSANVASDIQALAAQHGAFDLGFLAMPAVIFSEMPLAPVFGLLWFLLLFCSGLIASTALLQAIIAFFQDEMRWSRKKATLLLAAMTVVYIVPVVLFLHHGYLDELDFWGGTVMLVIAALVEVLFFVGLLGIKRIWEGITTGARMRVPILFRFILQYVTPLFLLVVFGAWLWKDALGRILMTDVDPKDQPYILGARISLWVVLFLMLLFLRHAWHKQQPLTAEEQLDALMATDVGDMPLTEGEAVGARAGLSALLDYEVTEPAQDEDASKA
jgi:SNF family Na+-dependent transporter